MGERGSTKFVTSLLVSFGEENAESKEGKPYRSTAAKSNDDVYRRSSSHIRLSAISDIRTSDCTA